MSTDYHLAYGTHASPEDGRCAMEWVSYLAGEPHGDDPRCVSPVLRAYCTTLNDTLADAPRQLLRPFLARTIGTAEDGLDDARAWTAMDWLIRTYTATWLEAAHRPEAAATLAALPPVGGAATLRSALEGLQRVRAGTHLAEPRSRFGRWSPAAAGRAAAREAAWSSAGAAAWAAARVALGDMAGDRARALAREIGGEAAASIACTPATGLAPSAAAGGRDAARAAARAALAPALASLQGSALALLDLMLPTVALTAPAPSPAPGANRPRTHAQATGR